MVLALASAAGHVSVVEVVGTELPWVGSRFMPRLAVDEAGRGFELQPGVFQAGQTGIIDPASIGFNYNAVIRQGIVPGQAGTFTGIGFQFPVSSEALQEISNRNAVLQGFAR